MCCSTGHQTGKHFSQTCAQQRFRFPASHIMHHAAASLVMLVRVQRQVCMAVNYKKAGDDVTSSRGMGCPVARCRRVRISRTCMLSMPMPSRDWSSLMFFSSMPRMPSTAASRLPPASLLSCNHGSVMSDH